MPPGLRHDPAGTASFPGTTDYQTPGSPHDGFSVNWSGSTGFLQNDNNFGGQVATTVATAGGGGSASWTGEIAGVMRITHEYTLGLGSERINVKTTITALDNLERVTFARRKSA